jgi:hypothetical protein
MNKKESEYYPHPPNCTCEWCAKKLNEQRVHDILESTARQNQEEAKANLAKIDAIGKGGIIGNEKWNPKKKRWDSLGRPRFISNHNILRFVSFILILAILYIIIAIIIDHFAPNSTWHIFIW